MIVSVASMHGMEDINSWSMTVGNTKINLTKGNMLDYYVDGIKKVDCIVVDKYVSRKNNSNELAQNCFLQKNKNNILEVGGPHVQVSIYGDVFYERFNPQHNLYRANLFSRYGVPHSRDEVVAEALKDLKVCYKDVLIKAAQKRKENLATSIALSAPSIGSYKVHFENNHDLENKAALCTIEIILDCIKNNPGSYNCIELFVKEYFEFDLYKWLLEKSAAEK